MVCVQITFLMWNILVSHYALLFPYFATLNLIQFCLEFFNIYIDWYCYFFLKIRSFSNVVLTCVSWKKVFNIQLVYTVLSLKNTQSTTLTIAETWLMTNQHSSSIFELTHQWPRSLLELSPCNSMLTFPKLFESEMLSGSH